MDIITEPAEMAAAARKMGADGTIGLVPTMGYLHDGHLSLVRAARAGNRRVVVSIFVNPAQFGPAEDLGRYPRDMGGDIEKCRAEGADIVFAPEPAGMYPEGFSTYVDVGGGLAERLCGASRPGHFRGVATVVCKLFGIIRPDRAYFGAKDYQQTVIVRRMTLDLNTGVEVVVLPTVREPDGLAMSSRNAYLNPEERKAAASVYASLAKAAAMRAAGVTDASELLAAVHDVIALEPLIRLEYAELVDPDLLTPVVSAAGGAVLALAARVGSTRLIDNITL